MKERSFDEMVAYFNHRVSEMDIAQDYKMELLGMVTALGYKHEKTAQHWIPCSVKYPESDERVLVTSGGYDYYVWDCMSNRGDDYFWEDEEGLYHNKYEVVAWMPLPEPWRGDEE